MKTIWKVRLVQAVGSQEIKVPVGFKPLHVDFQDDEGSGFSINSLYVWGEVFPENPVEPISMYIVGTGQEVPDGVSKHYKYIGTAVSASWVWHVYVQDKAINT